MLHPTLHGLVKAVLIVLVVIVALLAPLFIWKTVDPRSYEDFHLQSVSPFSMDGRRAILEKRQGVGKATKSGILP
ncbi:MAG: hypothetical protein VX610_08080 [SAR324 cluster bacterium]|nr:hypothetical protein [SAR324 cluster bacterium]